MSLFIDISSINSSFKNFPSHLKVELLLFGDSRLSAVDNNLILKASINECKQIFSTIVLILFSLFSFKYINSFFLRCPRPPDSFFTVLFERTVIQVLVLYFLVSFLVISLLNIFHLFFALSNCNQLYCRKKRQGYHRCYIYNKEKMKTM